MVKPTRAQISGYRSLYLSLSMASFGEKWELIYLLYGSLDQVPTRVSDRQVPWASTGHPEFSLGRG